MSSPSDPLRTAPGPHPDPTGGRIDEHGAIYYPGDEEAQRAPGSALVLLVLSLVAGGLYVWLFWPQKASFDWATAITLETPELAVLGGLVMWLGGVLFIRHGLIWATRVGSVIAALPMARMLIQAVVDRDVMDVDGAALSFVLSGGPALLVLALSLMPAVSRWRQRRRRTVAAAAAERRTGRRPAAGPQRLNLN